MSLDQEKNQERKDFSQKKLIPNNIRNIKPKKEQIKSKSRET
jgi:hypothetical protein